MDTTMSRSLSDSGEAEGQVVSIEGDSDSSDSDCAMDQPTLLEQLKTILENYQDAQIIRELIQNADDASATEMKIIYVKDTAVTKGGNLKQCGCYSDYFRVPALCVYNNALFNKDDWRYIRSIYRSGKREDSLKVGRFGLGFKSVFHMTDNPVIISGDQLLVIDPFRTKNKLGNDCHTLKFKKLHEADKRKRHYNQAVVALETLYGHCGFTRKSLKDGFHATLFWFPLRRTSSKLSTKVFNHRDVKELIAMFKKEAHCLPLFLKTITQISFQNNDEISSFSVTCSVSAEKDEKASFNMKLSACKGRLPHDDLKAIFPVKVTVHDGKQTKTQRWVVCNYIKGLDSLSVELRTLANDRQLSYSPFVGIAVPIEDSSNTKFHGHVFCFLPLPSTGENYTGLPVHINGFFALSQDRHHVKWPTDNENEREDEAQKWNRLLCEEVIVDAYTDTIEYVKKLTVKPKSVKSDYIVYKILPSRSDVLPNWDAIVSPLYRSLERKEIFYTKNDGGKWIQSKDAVFSILKWNEDKLLPPGQEEQCIVDVLLDSEENVVNVPPHVAEMFPEVPRITPEYLRDIMRGVPDVYTTYPSEHKLIFLQFVLADRQYSDLEDMELLPVEDDTFTVFNDRCAKYICTEDEMKMFPGIEENFVKIGIPHSIHGHLQDMQREDTFDLRNINQEEFVGLIQDTLIENGKLEKSGCFEITTSYITMKWLDRVFRYIRKHDIPPEKIEYMCLVPEIDCHGSKHILRLMPLKGTYIVAECGGKRPLDPHLSKALSNLQVTVLRQIPKGDTYTALMGTYCQYSDLDGIYEVFEGLCDACKGNQQAFNAIIRHFNNQSSLEEKAALLNLLSNGYKNNEVDDLMRNLDIFPETSNGDNDVKYTSVSKNGRIAGRNSIPVKYHVPLLQLNTSQKQVAERLGATVMSEGKIVEEILRAATNKSTSYKRSDIECFMRYVLKHLNSFGASKTNVLEFGSRIKFVDISTASKRKDLVSIQHFFDHTDGNLQELFNFDKSKFLPKQFLEEGLEPSLRKFGLKSEKDVQIKDVQQIVQLLDQECRKQKQVDKKGIRKCSMQVMKILDKLASNSSNNLDSLHLHGYRWIPFIRNKPSHYPDVLPWFGKQFESLLCSLDDVSSNIHESLSASVKCIVETSTHPYLAESYGWTNPPSVEVCLSQLDAVRNNFCIEHKSTLMWMIEPIYRQISDHIKPQVKISQSTLKRLKSEAVVCTGENFCHPEDVFISFPKKEHISLEPFMYKLPVEFSEFSAMFELLGSTAELTISSFKSLLASIKAKTGPRNISKNRKIVIRILKCIASLQDRDTSLEDVLIPVKSDKSCLELHPVKNCTYFDKESSSLPDNDEENNIKMVHSDVTAALAESLGIQSFSQKFMSDGGMEEMYSACGQAEPLTTRLKHILENYPDGLAVFKELIQNADDAGAQRIHFLYDERKNENARTGLIDKNMAECQGPALWAYNDANLTEDDFRNIVKLGGETKKGTKTKIGKFGLGFCAVYNLTDVPSFLSGSSLVIFDPHTTYLGKAIKDKSSPGIRMTFTEKSSAFLKFKRNQFRPYNEIFGCDFSGGNRPPQFEGTLFRLPLRTQEQAVKSAIKNTTYCKKEMVRLLHLLKDCAGNLLTFTQSIKEIKLFHLSEYSENPANDIQLIFSTDKAVTKTHPMISNPAYINVMKEVEKACRTKQTFAYIEAISVTMHMPKNRFLCVEKAHKKSSAWLVAWASGTDRGLLQNEVCQENETALPLGSIAVSLKEKGSGFTAVPFPHREKLLGFYEKSHLFCFLPLPVECKTPVHINGCFAISSDRKGLVRSTSDEKGETTNQIWNRMLMSDAVCNAYLWMLVNLDKFGVFSEIYSTLWPIFNTKSDIETYLSDAFCQKVISGDYKVFYTTKGHRASFRESVFLDNGLRHNSKVGDIAFEIFQRWYQGANTPLDMPEPLYQRFGKAGCEEELRQQTMSMKTFFETIVFPNINQIEEKKRDALVIFMLKQDRHHFQDLLTSNPCIPVLPDGRLKLPSDLVRPKSKISTLFCNRDGRFPSDANQQFCTEKILDVLVQLGMMDDTLSDELLVERAQSIAKLSDTKEALRRCRKILTYLDRKQHDCLQVMNDLKSIAFIPSLQKPSHWPLAWAFISSSKGKVKFFPPNQMFFPEHMKRVACSQLVVDMEELKSGLKERKVLQLLGVREDISQKDVETQLLAISKVCREHLTNMQRSTLHSICISVYEYFDNLTHQVQGKYDDLPIIWMSHQMIPPSRATLEKFYGIDCIPAIYQLGSSDVTKYTNFLKGVGVKDTLSKENVISALEIAQKDNKITPSLDNVKLTVNLLQLLVQVCERSGVKLNSDEKSCIFVPDDKDIFRLADELCVDDGYPLKRQRYMHFVNTKVSGEIIKLLDIRSKREKHLKSIKGSMPFGQKEELVKRLGRILEGYPRDETILYELLQNADDAGAKEIMFIEDMRQHEAKKGVFGTSWSAIQGPALCVFNDSCFTDEDLQGICKLGQGSKSQDPTKTGQFGIGFNVVYHLTDAPSFITKGPKTPNHGTFCVFDPQCKFCPVAEDNPGLQIPDLKSLKESYPSVYDCYLQKELPRKQGTWFRFPLRSKQLATESLICNKPMQSSELKNLLELFQKNMKKCLLFLRNVRKISLCEIDKHGNIKVNHAVESSLGTNDENYLGDYSRKCDELTQALHDKSMDITNVEMQTVKYTMTIEDQSSEPERWIIAQSFGFDSSAKIPESVVEAFECSEIALTPKGAVALPCISQCKDNEVRTMAEYHIKRYSTRFPKYRDGQWATQMSQTDLSSNESKFNGQAFCFLPLPLKTGLPVHVNGHFAVCQTRGSMWEKSYRGDWNRLLFETAVAKSYVLAIDFLRQTHFIDDRGTVSVANEDLKSSLDKYHEVFPQFEEGKTDFIKYMIASFFSILYEKESTVFPVLSQNASHIWWVALQQSNHAYPACFNNLLDQFQQRDDVPSYRLVTDYNAENKQRSAKRAHKLSNILKDLGMKILESPMWIHKSIVQALQAADNMFASKFTPENHLVHPAFVIQFLRTGTTTHDACLLQHVDCTVTETPVKSVENTKCLLKYCLKDLENFGKNIDRLPLLVTNDEIVRCFSTEQPVILSPFCDLLPRSARHFVHREIVTLLDTIPLNNRRCLKCLDLNNFSQMLLHNVDMSTLAGRSPILWDKEKISAKWIHKFWEYMDSMKDVDIQALHNWCFIPGELKMTRQTGGRTEILVPCDKGFFLLNSRSFESECLREILDSLQIPTPQLSYCYSTLWGVVASQQDPLKLVQCLHYHKENLKSLTSYQCYRILEHLLKNIEILRTQPSILDKIKDLSLFTTVSGKNVTIRSTNIFIVKEPGNLTKDGIETWYTECGCILLEENYFVLGLMHYLNRDRIISVPDLYCRHILPRFFNLEQKHHLKHLEYVRNMLRNEPACPFKEALRTSEFICHEGRLKRADCFYSPKNSLCRKLCDASMLPPDPFGNKEWHTLMVCAGMKEEVSEDLFIKFAKQIESKARSDGMTVEILQKSKEMVKYLFATKNFRENTAFLETIKNIRFVEPYFVPQVYEEVCPQFGCEGLIQFCNSVSSSLSNLVWTNTNILPRYVRTDWVGLGILNQPPLRNVLSHTHNVCHSINTKLRQINRERGDISDLNSEPFIDDLMTEIYEYLQEHCIDNHEAKRMLFETPLVHIKEEKIFVCAKQISVAFDGKKPIPPYLVEIPLHYGRYNELFQFIGTTKIVTLSQYAEVLDRIQAEVKSNMLGPDHIDNVLTALKGIMMLLEQNSLTEITDSMQDVDTLYLPTSDKRMAKSTDLVYTDKPSLRSRIMKNVDHGLLFLHSLKDCHMQEDLILKLPENLKPRVLSSSVKECLLSSPRNTKQDTKVEQLGAFLASRRLLSVIQKIGKFSDHEFEIYSHKLLQLQLISLSEITTVLMVDSREILGTVAQQDCLYSVDESESKLYFVANSNSVRQWLKEVGETLFGTLSDCLDNRISPEKIRELVDYMDDENGFKKYIDKHLERQENEEDESLSYLPGKLVPLALHELLENEITLLKVGELVAYEKFDPLIDDDESDTSTGPVFIFTRIMKVLSKTSASDLLQEYEVSFGQGISETVSRLRLYKVRYPETPISTELVLHQFGHDGCTPLKRNKIFDEIIVCLSDAWKLEDEHRKRIIKRLLLVWHPDKNAGKGHTHHVFCEDVTKFILDIMRRLNEGEHFGTDTAKCKKGQNKKRDYDNWTYGKCSNTVQVFADRVSSNYRESHRYFTESRGRRGHRVPNPQPGEAKRWFRQAAMDFQCGVNSLKLNNTTECDCQCKEDNNWICFKFHQACEKACKAYMYLIDAEKVTHSHNLRSIIPSVPGNEKLVAWLQKAEDLVGNYSRMRYPDLLSYPNIPGTSYTKEQATALKELTEKIMEEIENKM